MFGHEPAEGQLTHLNHCSRYYGDNDGKIMLGELYKLWKHHAGRKTLNLANLEITLTSKLVKQLWLKTIYMMHLT